ncbi:uncharacterized protein PHACADRAFT_189735 [Phanerochaete carnosa HHB-10118-sp]|uniref:Uncharacterized protein n=1 Tax=Phanerochaete carnosa (strain HHB-10118-sp) TaxID=650164 RepID=K5W9H1_PHACS|nr:uncharacterized protein PHACADRAFT_189735 [Phanerochaete carnosa HHB-10118-sp]EKM60608.1 hypothetical protein PHACADRAFT_189735 [Phanerochaete carnosa HHB-10118-sp]
MSSFVAMTVVGEAIEDAQCERNKESAVSAIYENTAYEMNRRLNLEDDRIIRNAKCGIVAPKSKVTKLRLGSLHPRCIFATQLETSVGEVRKIVLRGRTFDPFPACRLGLERPSWDSFQITRLVKSFVLHVYSQDEERNT